MSARRAARRLAGATTGPLLVAVVAALAAGAVVGLGGRAGAVAPGVAGTTAAAGATTAPPTTYYLAIGASESVGVQPTPADPHGQRTDQGYADDLLATERARWPGLHLVQVGCPGETAVAAVDGSGGGGGPGGSGSGAPLHHGGARCHYPLGSQLATAVAFLRSHPAATVLATVDLGFNDVRPCLVHGAIDQGCVTTALAGIGQVLPGALAQLQAAGGPTLRIVGLEHDDPYLGDYLDGPTGQAFALASVTVVDRLNATLSAVYSAAGAAVADVPRAFRSGDLQPVATGAFGTVPAEVAEVCERSWSCSTGPTAHNVHPNAQGYQVIAGAVAAALGTGDG